MPYQIDMTTKTYHPTQSGKGFQKQAATIEYETINQTVYENITSDDTLRFFRRLAGSESAIRDYTSAGYRIVKLISISPDKDRRIVREFSFNWYERI